jgi:hypothetical protein
VDTAEITRLYLLYVVLPLWVLAAFADYWCHRASVIESTSGLKETLIHFLMLAEAGSAVLAGLLFEINALVLALMLVALLAHELTAYWDVAYAHPRREITPLEQRVHDYLGTIPFMAFSFVLVLHWDSVAAFMGEPLAPENWSLWWKRDPLPLAYILGLLGAIALFDILPYLEELWRDLRARHLREGPGQRRPAAIRR